MPLLHFGLPLAGSPHGCDGSRRRAITSHSAWEVHLRRRQVWLQRDIRPNGKGPRTKPAEVAFAEVGETSDRLKSRSYEWSCDLARGRGSKWIGLCPGLKCDPSLDSGATSSVGSSAR